MLKHDGSKVWTDQLSTHVRSVLEVVLLLLLLVLTFAAQIGLWMNLIIVLAVRCLFVMILKIEVVGVGVHIKDDEWRLLWCT